MKQHILKTKLFPTEATIDEVNEYIGNQAAEVVQLLGGVLVVYIVG